MSAQAHKIPAPCDGFTCSGYLQIWDLEPCLDSAGVYLLFPGGCLFIIPWAMTNNLAFARSGWSGDSRLTTSVPSSSLPRRVKSHS